eukprot:CAMPEP_0181273710 /NCGR_PEP_ID=MMETSP1097-20121128/8796_1 /TAXON_ID=35684 /ORGANISM="Pseudopedinella elastica, Strain CCMP716" /LENGTH=33 /DNA_ID= /DNA_START= /DNA_END= /DNA_ORIENTATION=
MSEEGVSEDVRSALRALAKSPRTPARSALSANA